jgi:IMP cyclohydrolase
MPAAADPLISLSGYPGRGLVLWRGDAGVVGWLYFLTGRSSSSRARLFVEQGSALAVVPVDEAASVDPLRHYVCATRVEGSDRLVIGNGDHVSAIARAQRVGTSLASAVSVLDPEPDPPINTPRIAAVIDGRELWLVAVVGGDDGRGAATRRVEAVDLGGGEMVVLHTYGGTVDEPLGSAPQWRGAVPTGGVMADVEWDRLDPALRVGLVEGSAPSPVPVRVRLRATDGDVAG